MELLEPRYALTVPVAVDDFYFPSYSPTPQTTGPLFVLVNDTDVAPSLARVTEINGNPVTEPVGTPPAAISLANGTLNLSADHKSFEFTPAAGFTGLQTFTYKVGDGTTESATAATVSIDVRPVAAQEGSPGQGTYTIYEGGEDVFSGQPLVLDATPSLAPGPVMYFWSIGTYELNPAGSTDPTLPVTWADLNAAGILDGNVQSSVTLRIEDGNGEEATSSVLLDVINVAPVISNLAIVPVGGGACGGSDYLLTADVFDPNPLDNNFTVEMYWDFFGTELGDPETFTINASGTFSLSVPHTYSPGVKLPVLQVTGDGPGDPDPLEVAAGLLDGDGTLTVPPGGGGGEASATIEDAPATVAEGTAVSLTSTASASCDGTIIEYAWEVLKNGDFFAGVTGTSASFSFTPDDNGTYVVKLSVTDSNNATADAEAQTITVTNVAPANLSILATPAAAGSPEVALTGSFTDPGSADTFTLHIVWGPSDTEDVVLPAGSTSFSVNHTYPSVGLKPISVTVSDDDGGQSNQAADSVTVQAAVDGSGALAVLGTSGNDQIRLSPGSVKVEINGTLVGTFAVTGGVTVNAGSGNDTITIDAGVTAPITVNGEGGTDTVVLSGTSGNDTFVQTSSGFVLNGTAVTLSSIESASISGGGGSDAVVATGAPPVPVQVAGISDMVVEGGPGNDDITFTPGSTAGQIVGKLNGVEVSRFSPMGKLVARGGGGDDDIQVSGSIGLSAWLYGGPGHDRIKGGGGNDVILGESGNDLLVGGQGRDLMIGGTGEDRIVGDPGDDILIAGWTDYDSSPAALASIMAIWTSGDSFLARVCQLAAVLDNDGSNATVHDDNNKDILTGSAGTDWFFANLWLDAGDDAETKDKITDLSLIELLFAQDIDFIESDI